MKKYLEFFVAISVLSFISVSHLFASVVSQKATGEQKILIIMAKFPDVTPSFSMEKMRIKYLDKLDRYLKAVSVGKTVV